MARASRMAGTISQSSRYDDYAVSQPPDTLPYPPAAPPARRGDGPWIPATLLILGAIAFAAIAADLHFHGALDRLNDPVNMRLHDLSRPWGILLFSTLTYLGDLKVVLAIAFIVGLWLLITRRHRSLALWAIALAGSAVLNLTFKSFFRVARPGRWTYYVFDPNSGFSFPSGHTMAVGVTAGAAVLILLHHFPAPPRTRVLAGAAVGALCVLIAFGLLYVGVHTLTDVLGGLALTCAWLGVLRFFLPPARFTPPASGASGATPAPTAPAPR
jgi:undecaprenyl-diphosphatase